jgi:chromosome segregation ATPase
MGRLLGLLRGDRARQLERELAEWTETAHRLEESVASLAFERDRLWQEIATWRHAANCRLDGINDLENMIERLNMQVEALTKEDQRSKETIEYLLHELSMSQESVEQLKSELSEKPAASKRVAKKDKQASSRKKKS